MVEDLTMLNPKRLGRRLEELARDALPCVSAVASHADPEHGLTVALWIESHGRGATCVTSRASCRASPAAT